MEIRLKTAVPLVLLCTEQLHVKVWMIVDFKWRAKSDGLKYCFKKKNISLFVYDFLFINCTLTNRKCEPCVGLTNGVIWLFRKQNNYSSGYRLLIMFPRAWQNACLQTAIYFTSFISPMKFIRQTILNIFFAKKKYRNLGQ